jgi:hypothetical protein
MKEDVRETLPAKGDFYNMLLLLFKNKETVNILFDSNGITRANGLIKEISERNESPFLILGNDLKIEMHSIIAVNGIFTSDYSEC